MAMKQNLEFSKLYGCQLVEGVGLGYVAMDASAEMVLTKRHPVFLALDPAGTTKTVLLPAESDMVNKVQIIRNTADAGGEDIIVEEDSSTTRIATIGRGQTAWLFCDGTSWYTIAQQGGEVAAVTVKVPLVAVTDTTAGGILTWANPTGASIIVTRFMIDITTGSTGAATGDFGIASSVASNDTLLDGFNMQTTGVADNIENQGTNGVAAKKMTSTSYITGTASATVAGLVGSAYISYIPA